ncbi:MAG: beta-ketoacyl-[acyl-carrier-protein] synthase family protein [Deltaproteobacteria bacterium]|nr:beta-ketoacyl-[acyl-carrier-protein] synthase family protein [Deltaproteobacteria bacterium]
MKRRVVVTGMGVISPNGTSLENFESALRRGESGIRYIPVLEELNFGCTVGGVPQGVDELAAFNFDEEELLAMNMNHRYGSLAALQAWKDAGFERPERADDRVYWEAGAIIGSGIGGIHTIAEKLVPTVKSGRVRRLGSTLVEQIMGSGVSARVSGLLALGNKVSSNSAACSTGNEAIADGYLRIKCGLAERMLCGGSESSSYYIWAGFDAMKVLARKYNDTPERASRPMSASAAGFVPSSGAAILHLENLENAQKRGVRIYAEVLGAALNCGGHRNGGSMTAPNPVSVQRCIKAALSDAGIGPEAIDVINGHLTATFADPSEIASWAAALERMPGKLPFVISTKSMVGHALGAAGAIESVATVLMLHRGFVHPSINCEDVHPEIEPYANSIPHETKDLPELRTAIKAGFGFGDVNACLVFRKWES